MGTAVLRRYVLMGPIGHGGVSVVYRGVDTVTARPMAFKMLDPRLAADSHAQDRVRREALITARMRHPSVPRVFDFGDAPMPDGTIVPFVVMELLSGVSLTGRLASGPLPWREAVSIAATSADVLAVAHRRGVVHRDLSAENIMMTGSGPKIIDFGVAVTVEPGMLSATPSVFGRDDDRMPNEFPGVGEPADDVYALGVLLFQMLTGRSPFPDAKPGALLAASRFRCIAPMPILPVPGMPREVADICRACMARRPTHRATAAEVALALWAVLTPGPDLAPHLAYPSWPTNADRVLTATSAAAVITAPTVPMPMLGPAVGRARVRTPAGRHRLHRVTPRRP
jgi:serine/threonine-protein kinase